MGTTNILDMNNRISDLEKTVSGGDSTQANKKDIATEFSATTNYTAGCFVYYEGKLYQFNADHSAGAWDATDVVEANVTDQVVSNKSAIEGLTASDIMMSDGVTSVEDMIQVGRKRVDFTSSASRTIHGYIDIPAQCVAIIGWRVLFINANPSETFICLTNSAETHNFIAFSQFSGCTATWWNDTDSPIRLYVGATYSSAASNYGDITYTFIKKVQGG